jgi:hypothetical protein
MAAIATATTIMGMVVRDITTIAMAITAGSSRCINKAAASVHTEAVLLLPPAVKRAALSGPADH